VPQEVFLFSDSIKENMSFGLEQTAEDQEIKKWAQQVDLENEINELPQKFDSQLGERGVNLSGGQKQRLTIVRGMMTRASVLLLDDVLSAVDVKTELEIQAQINSMTKQGRTLVIVSHRLNSVVHADKIIVMKDGEIEAIGKHSELMRTSATYKTLAAIQGYSA
jgi:ATP-binding cassette subfamily B protein